MSSSVIVPTDSIPTVSSEPLPISCSSSTENGVNDEESVHKEEQEPSTYNAIMQYEAVFCFEFLPDASSSRFHSTLGSICNQSCIPPSSYLFPSQEFTHTFYLCFEKEPLSPMSWKGLNSLVSVSRVDYKHIESLLDRKNIISLLDLPNFDMNGGSEVLAGLEKDIQKLSVSKENSPVPSDPRPAKADPTTVKKALIVTITKGELKTDSEEKMRGLANDAVFDTSLKEVTVVIDPCTDDHFFLLFVRPSHILDNIASMRRGLLEGQVTFRKVAETTPVVQDRFLELAADPSRCFPVEIKKKEKVEPENKRVSITTTAKSRLSVINGNNGGTSPGKSEPSTPPSEESRRASRGPTSGHIARRLVEGSLGIRSTVTREQVKKENQLVASFAAEKRATRQAQRAVTNQVNEAFQ